MSLEETKIIYPPLTVGGSHFFLIPKSAPQYQEEWTTKLRSSQDEISATQLDNTKIDFLTSVLHNTKITYAASRQNLKTSTEGFFSFVFQNKAKNKDCPALLLINLADPQWVSVDCSAKIAKSVVCSIISNQTIQDTHNHLNVTKRSFPSAQFCSSGLMLKAGDECFSFQWMTANKASQLVCFKNTAIFENILVAVSAKRTPAIFCSETHLVEPHRYKSHMKFEEKQIENPNQRAFCIRQHDLKVITSQGNLFRCQDGTLISPQHICDGNVDCSSDETQCNCSQSDFSSANATCKYLLLENGKVGCSPLFDSTKNECHPHLIRITGTKETPTDVEERVNNFSCHSENKIIPFDLKDDLVVDCLPDGEDEPLLQSIRQTKAYLHCTQKSQIPCREGHPKCYDITEICSYSLSNHGYLKPCRTGDHLQECEEFHCNTMFACPKSYCIPWKYLCDGKWDCLKGFDESQLCGQNNQQCPNLFKCKETNVCIHLIEVCNDIIDCFLGDDESLCSLTNAFCPQNCKCLTFAAFCQDINILPSMSFTFYKFIMLDSSVVCSNVDLLSDSTWSFKITHSNISSVCDLMSEGSKLQFVNIAHNRIVSLSTGCFKKTKLLAFIAVDFNCLTSLQVGLLNKLDRLQFLNISSNPIQELVSETFSDLSGMKAIFLLNMTINEADGAVFAGLNVTLLQVSDFALCCLAESSSVCTVAAPWYFSCDDMLPSSLLKGTFWTISFAIMCLNVVATALQEKQGTDEKKRSRPSRYITLSVIASDLIFVVAVLIACVADHTFQGVFFIKGLKWHKSFFCWCVYFLFLFFAFLSPSVLCILSFSRLQIVKRPFDTKFKEAHFVFKLLTVVFLVILCLVSLFTLTVWLLDTLSLNKVKRRFLCSPFVDLSHTLVVPMILTFLKVFWEVASLVCIFTSYFNFFQSISKSQDKMKASTSKAASNVPFYIQIIPTTVSSTLGWIPSAVVFILCLFLKRYSLNVLFWTTIVIVPLNSLVNPIVFITGALRK